VKETLLQKKTFYTTISRSLSLFLSHYWFHLFARRVHNVQALLPAAIKEFAGDDDDPNYVPGVYETYTHVILVMCPLFAAMLAPLIITTTPLPVYRTNWINTTFSFFRNFKISDAEEGNRIAKENQFLKGAGQLNFDWVAICFIVIPCGVVNMVGYETPLLKNDYAEERDRWYFTAYMFGWAGTMMLSFFLIPVTRHSVLLVAMGWSPVHALRIHIVAGWFSWWYIAIHGIMYVVFWFKYEDSVVAVIWPEPGCWTMRYPDQAFEGGLEVFYDNCAFQFYNFSGILAGLFFLVLAASSINWFRRKNYRLFYILHVTFGSLTLIATCFHFPDAPLFIMPSLVYYLASTSPTLIQALASYYRGGHKIVKVVDLGLNGGNCIEVHVETDTMTDAALMREPCSYIKLCVPSISMVWHPFTVFRHSKDPQTVHILFRPVGPFTSKLATKLLSTPQPIAILDGLYSVGNHTMRAMTHDHVVIVTGGVAITPFLSLIPNLFGCLQQLVDKGMAITTKKIVLHWVCREENLIQYVLCTYLHPMMIQATRMMSAGITFEVHIHRTGSLPDGHTAGKVTIDSVSGITDKTAEFTQEEMEESMDSELDVDDPSTWPAKKSSDKKLADSEVDKDSYIVDGSGFAMELARMMPGRYSKVCQNLALFLAFAVLIMSGQWIYFHFEAVKNYQWSYNIFLNFWISNLIWLTTVFVGSCLIEGLVLHMRRYWPSPPPQQNKDLYAVNSVVKELACKKDDDTDDTKGPALQYEEHIGRPVVGDLLDEPRHLGTSPALFTCGPATMTNALRKEAQMEDSFGLARFVLYEEVFEM
jgi:predicted ferric reductase